MAHRDALVGQRGTGQRPAAVDLADDEFVRHEDFVEEDLVEHRLTSDLAQGAHVNAGRLHVDQEVGDPLVLWRVRVGARQADRPVGAVRDRRPHLLPGQ